MDSHDKCLENDSFNEDLSSGSKTGSDSSSDEEMVISLSSKWSSSSSASNHSSSTIRFSISSDCPEKRDSSPIFDSSPLTLDSTEDITCSDSTEPPIHSSQSCSPGLLSSDSDIQMLTPPSSSIEIIKIDISSEEGTTEPSAEDMNSPSTSRSLFPTYYTSPETTSDSYSMTSSGEEYTLGKRLTSKKKRKTLLKKRPRLVKRSTGSQTTDDTDSADGTPGEPSSGRHPRKPRSNPRDRNRFVSSP